MSKWVGRFMSFVFSVFIFLLNCTNLYSEDYKLENEERYVINKIYTDEYLKEIAFPLGGLGAGQIYVRGNGKLSPWEIINNFNSNANVSDAFFSIFVDNGEQSKARILQMNPPLPGEGVNKIKFAGEFPFAELSFEDFTPSLKLSMECFSPFVPMDEKNSALPAIFFTFKLKNTDTKAIKGILAGTMPNIIGWDGYGELMSSNHTIDGKDIFALSHPELNNNTNLVKKESDFTHIEMGVVSTGKEGFSRQVNLYTNFYDCAYPVRYLPNININFSENINTKNELDESVPNVYWLGPSDKILSSEAIQKLDEDIENGACLIVSGDRQSIFDWAFCIHKAKRNRKKDFVFDNFEGARYNQWTITGEAFGDKPTEGKFDTQTDIIGYEGKHLVNTYNNDDKKTGMAISKEFTIQYPFIQFRVGGGKKPDNLYVALVVDGIKVFSATGSDTEILKKVIWNVSEYIGKKAHIEIVDNASDGWGHILVDEIIFSCDYPIDKKSYKTLLEWLPIASKQGGWVDEIFEVNAETISANLKDIKLSGNRIFKPKSKIKGKHINILLETSSGIPLLVKKDIGKGSVIWCNGKVTDWVPAECKRNWTATLINMVSNVPYAYYKGLDSEHPLWGNMAFSIKSNKNQEPMTCAQWRDFNYFWQHFSKNGALPEPEDTHPSSAGYTWNGSIAYPFELLPGEEEEVFFILTWYFPNRTRGNQYFWTLPQLKYDYRLGNYYNNYFHSAMEVTDYCINNYPYLLAQTAQFHKDFFTSTLPPVMLEAISANIATLHTPIYIYLEDGTVGGFEGTDNCCPMNCTHVYNYAQTLPYLFPRLEQRIRYQELFYQVDKTDSYIPHRLVVPVTEAQLKDEIGGPQHHALDGELGTLLKLYRDYKMSNDRKWIEPIWHNAVKVFQHILEKHDPAGEGIIRGEQPNTYDTHIYGSNTFIGSLYLATLKAMETMLKELGSPEPNLITECQRRYESGINKYIETCWNGEYFINVFDAPGVGPEVYNQMNCYGTGCHSDQLLGQWWAHILGIGYLFPETYIKSTLNSIYQYNWRKNFYDHVQLPRRFAEDDEPGLLMCTWPKGGRPESPILYSDEIWTGIEYELAGFFIYERDWEKAIEIVNGARSRYQGNRKNPWSEIECGGHYARAMSAYAMLLAASGFQYDNGTIKITPHTQNNPCQFFFTTASSWGIFELDQNKRGTKLSITPHYGKLEINKISIPAEKNKFNQLTLSIVKDNKTTPITEKAGITNKDNYYDNELITIIPRSPINVNAGEEVLINVKW